REAGFPRETRVSSRAQILPNGVLARGSAGAADVAEGHGSRHGRRSERRSGAPPGSSGFVRRSLPLHARAFRAVDAAQLWAPRLPPRALLPGPPWGRGGRGLGQLSLPWRRDGGNAGRASTVAATGAGSGAAAPIVRRISSGWVVGRAARCRRRER